MAFEGQQSVKLQGAVAGADLSASSAQYKFVKYNGTDNQVVLCSGVNDVPCGVLQAPAPSSAVGTPVEVLALGVTKIQISAGLSSGNVISTDANGRAKVSASGQTVAGQYMATQGGGSTAGDYGTMFVNIASGIKA